MPSVDRPTDEPAPPSDRSVAARFLRFAPEAYVLLCGLAHQIILRVNTFRLDYDHTCIMTTAVNFMRGGVLGSVQAPEYDLSVALQGALSHWPPGFALTLVFLRLVIKSMYVAMVSADVASLTVFYAGCLFLMAKLRGALTRPVRLLAAVTLAFVAPPYVEYFTNPWALGFFIWSVALLLPGENSEEPGVWACFAAGFLAGGAVAYRLAYLPVCVVPLLAGLVLFWKRPGGRERVAALFAGWCVVMLPMLWWKFIYTGGGGTTATQFSDKLHFRSFYRFHPFATDALWGDRASRLFPESVHKFRLSVNPNQYAVRHIFAWIILAAAIVGAREAIRNAPSSEARESLKRFFGLGAATVAFVVVFLSFMTLTHEPDRSIWSWVYVEEPRYYSPCLPFVLFGAAQMVTVTKRGLAMAVLRDMSVLGFATAAVFWVYTIPGEWRAIQTGQVGGKIEEYFRDDGKYVGLLRSMTVEDLPNVCVEIGYSNNATNIRMHETTFVGVPKAVIRPGGRLVSTRRINVMMVADPDQGQANADAFLRMCRANNGERMDGGGYYACRFVLEPTRRD